MNNSCGYSATGDSNLDLGLLQLQRGQPIRMKFSRYGCNNGYAKLEYNCGDLWKEVFAGKFPSSTAFCPSILISQPNIPVSFGPCSYSAVEFPDTQPPSGGFNFNHFSPATKFLIDSRLRISESSSLKALELLQSTPTPASGARGGAASSSAPESMMSTVAPRFEVTTVQLTADHLKNIAVAALLGKEDILEEVFGGVEGDGTSVLGSPIATESSFMVEG